jgi:tRNA(fMet)-specific endonuclease VapC
MNKSYSVAETRDRFTAILREVEKAPAVEVVAPTMPILPYDEQAAEWHAAERARLAGIGKTPPFADG